MQEEYEDIEKIEKEKDKRQKLIIILLILILLQIVFVVFIIDYFKRPISESMKPIIYIYPEKETEVSVKLGKTENLTCTYPKYENEWNVKAYPNGNLIDLKTGRKLYALYWEGKNNLKNDKIQEGFIVKGEEIAKFLEEKLEILGLNEKEAEEFIVYWLPQLEKNEYNFIKFYTSEEIEKEMPLKINPEPETIIRVLMGWKKVDKNIKVEEQKLEKVERKGYTVLEWGGTEINSYEIK